ncbi:MAG: glycerophosphodiester phosphodiesterase [Thermomicrobiales bacterium]
MTPERKRRGVGEWVRVADRVARVGIAILASLVIAGSLYLVGLFLVAPGRGEEWTVGRRPNQFYSELNHDRQIFSDATYASVLGVAHNSGGSIEATLEALVAGADVIEADVAAVDGPLYVAHDPPLPFIGPRWFRGPRLDRVWAATYGADAVMLDLKESSSPYLDLVVDFLEVRQRTRQVIISTRSPQALQRLHRDLPDVTLLLSVPDTATLRALQGNASLLAVVDGISVRHTVLEEENAAWLEERHLLTFAWTVNDMDRVNELMRLGVDGITSDNLAIVSLLGGPTDPQPIVPATPAAGGVGDA